MAEIFRPDFKKPAHMPRRDAPDRDAPLVRDDEIGEKPYCSHEFLAVLTKSRVVVCRGCRRQLEAFDVLLKLTLRWETATWLDNDIKQRTARIEELKRVEQNTKARIKRAAGTVPSAWQVDDMVRERRKEKP